MTKLIVKQSSPTLTVALFLARMTFRFFSGRPMNGKRLDNSSFTKGASRGKPGRVLSRWQKKPHIHRALIRGAVFWPIVGIIALYIYNGTAALLALVFCCILLAYPAFRYGRFLLFDPFTSTDAVNGVHSQHWIFKNRYRRLLRMQPRPGYVAKKKRVDLAEFPPEVAKALRESIEADEGGMVLKVTPYKRRSVK